jgi:chitinase
MTVGQIATDIGAVVDTGNAVLIAIEGADPAIELEAAAAANVLNVLADLVEAALAAYSNAGGTPITLASVQALMPNATPLTPPPTP